MYLLVLALCCAAAVLPVAAEAGESYEELYPYLIDLPGWDAEEPEGVDFRSSGMRMVGAERSYRKGETELKASIAVGQQAAAVWSPAYHEGFSMSTPDGQVEVKREGGFLTASAHKPKEGTGMLVILLVDPAEAGAQQGALLTLTYAGMGRSEAASLARRFDWKGIQAKARQFD
jgi:hypothetical protein